MPLAVFVSEGNAIDYTPTSDVAAGAVVRDSVIMNDTFIDTNARVERAIVDKEVYVGEGAEIGYGVDNVPNRLHPGRLNTGLTLVGKKAHIPAGVRIGHNVIINPGITDVSFQSDFIASGETV